MFLDAPTFPLYFLIFKIQALALDQDGYPSGEGANYPERLQLVRRSIEIASAKWLWKFDDINNCVSFKSGIDALNAAIAIQVEVEEINSSSPFPVIFFVGIGISGPFIPNETSISPVSEISFIARALPVNVNTATQSELEGIKGIGSSKAKIIIAERLDGGHFQDAYDFQKRVRGVGLKSFEKMVDSGLTIETPNSFLDPIGVAKEEGESSATYSRNQTGDHYRPVSTNAGYDNQIRMATLLSESSSPGEIYLSESVYDGLVDNKAVHCRFSKQLRHEGSEEILNIYELSWDPRELEINHKRHNAKAHDELMARTFGVRFLAILLALFSIVYILCLGFDGVRQTFDRLSSGFFS